MEKKLNIWLFGESHISDFLFLAKIRQKKTLEYQELINSMVGKTGPNSIKIFEFILFRNKEFFTVYYYLFLAKMLNFENFKG